MAEAIKRWMQSIRHGCSFGVFDMSPGELRYSPSEYAYPSVAEALQGDWARVWGDVHKSALTVYGNGG